MWRSSSVHAPISSASSAMSANGTDSAVAACDSGRQPALSCWLALIAAALAAIAAAAAAAATEMHDSEERRREMRGDSVIDARRESGEGSLLYSPHSPLAGPPPSSAGSLSASRRSKQAFTVRSSGWLACDARM